MSIFGREQTHLVEHTLDVPLIDTTVPVVLTTATFAAG